LLHKTAKAFLVSQTLLEIAFGGFILDIFLYQSQNLLGFLKVGHSFESLDFFAPNFCSFRKVARILIFELNEGLKLLFKLVSGVESSRVEINVMMAFIVF